MKKPYNSFIKLNRKILDWRWYKNINTKVLFIHLLLTANFTDCDFCEITVKRGQLVTSIQSLSEQTGLSPKSVRTALNHLKSTHEVAIKTTSKYSIITINNYNTYQNTASTSANQGQSDGNQSANEGQADGKPTASEGQQYKNVRKEEYKNDNNDKNVYKREGALSPHGQFQNVLLTSNELEQLEYNYPYDYEQKIERLSRYMASNEKRFKNHYATLIDWIETDGVTTSAPLPSSSIDYNKLNMLTITDV